MTHLTIGKAGNHFGCTMASITLKALSPSLHRALKAQANLHRRSLNQEVIAILQQAIAPPHRLDVEQMIADDRRFRTSFDFVTTTEEIGRYKREGQR
jgi:plasmid stability protein